MRELRLLWSHGDFRRLLLSQTISTAGDRVALVALTVLVTEQTRSTADLGLVIGSQSAALVGCLLLGGVWADRLPRHHIMVASDVIRAALHALAAVLIVIGRLELWMLVAIEVPFGAAEAFCRPACSGLLPQTVPEPLIQEANAVTALSQTVAQMGGPALASLLLIVTGTACAFAVDAATFLISALLLVAVAPRVRGPVAARAPLIREMRDGFREVRSRPWVSVTILVFCAHLVVAIAPYLTLGPAVAGERYSNVPLWGWIVAAVGLGTVIGSLTAVRCRPRRPLVLGLIAVMPFGGLLLVCAAGASLAIVVPIAVVAGAGVELFVIWWQTALSERIPPAALSRVSSLDWMGSCALLPVGYLAVGFLADRFGPARVMGAGGLIAVALPLVALCPRTTRRLTSSPCNATPASHAPPTFADPSPFHEPLAS